MSYNMGPDLDSKGKSSTDMDISPAEDGTASKVPEKMTCAKNCEDNSFLMEALPSERSPDQSEGPEINITDNLDSNEKVETESESEDATENSSSFADSDSGVRSGPNDVEVESQFHDYGSSSLAFDSFGDLFQTRKKKLTTHWRKFIRPLMWRCKWAELQIRELKAQGLKYDRQLAEYDQRKQHDLLNFTSEDLCVKSTPVMCENRRVNLMKRKKRKRVEDETDIESYMSQHNLFSTLVNKKSNADLSHMDDDGGNSVKPAKANFISDEFDVNGGWPRPEFKDDHLLEEMLQKIDESQLQLRMLRVRMDKVISENSTTIFSNFEASIPCNALTSSAPKRSLRENGDGAAGSLCTTSLHSSHNREDVLMLESAVSSHGEVTPPLDMVESSDQTHIGVSCLKIKDEVLIPDQFVVKEEVALRPIGKPKVKSALEDRNDVHPPTDAETVSQGKKVESPAAQQGSKMRSVSKLGTPKNKRKRARRKARFNKYRRTPG